VLTHEDLFDHPCTSIPTRDYRNPENAVKWSYECPNARMTPALL
jgi:hypothetical protein